MMDRGDDPERSKPFQGLFDSRNVDSDSRFNAELQVSSFWGEMESEPANSLWMPTQDTTGTSASLSSNVMNPGFNITVPRPFPYLHDSIRRTLGEVSPEDALDQAGFALYPWDKPLDIPGLMSEHQAMLPSGSGFINLNDPIISSYDGPTVDKVKTFAAYWTGSARNIEASSSTSCDTVDPSQISLALPSPYVTLREQASVLDGDRDVDQLQEALPVEATNQSATLHPEETLVRKRGIDNAEDLPAKKPKGRAKAVDKADLQLLSSGHGLSCVLEEFNPPGDHGYKLDNYSPVFDTAYHIILAEFSVIEQVEHQCLQLHRDQLPSDLIVPFSAQAVLRPDLYFLKLMHHFGKGRDGYVPIPPSPDRWHKFNGMAFISQTQIPSLLSRREYRDAAHLTETYNRGETCWALFRPQRIREYQIRRNFYVACLQTLGRFSAQPPEVIPLNRLYPGEGPLPVDDVKKKLSVIYKEEEKKKNMPRAGLVKEGPVAIFREKSDQDSTAHLFFSSKRVFNTSESNRRPPLDYVYTGFKESPAPALIAYFLDKEKEDRKAMVEASQKLFNDHFKPALSDNGKPGSLRYGTKLDLQVAIEQGNLDRIMPAKELQGLNNATAPIDERLPGSGQLVVDHLINIVLSGLFGIHQHFLGHIRLQEKQIRRSPRISPYMWAASCIVVEECVRRELNDPRPFRYYKEKYQCLVEIFVKMMVTRTEEYLSLEHALLVHTSNIKMWADIGAGYPSQWNAM